MFQLLSLVTANPKLNLHQPIFSCFHRYIYTEGYTAFAFLV